jgi:hypothetical protein
MKWAQGLLCNLGFFEPRTWIYSHTPAEHKMETKLKDIFIFIIIIIIIIITICAVSVIGLVTVDSAHK